MKELQVNAVVENIPEVTAFVDEQLEALDCPLKIQMQIDIAIDEIFSNIAQYAYNPDVGPATVRVEVAEDPLSVIITFIDGGVPYDPLAAADPNTKLSAEERSIGGLGIYIVKKSMDERATLSLMTRIVTRIEDAEGYIPGETPVAFVGSYSFDTYKPGFEEVGKVTGFSKHIDVTYYLTYHPYFNYMLNYPITILGEGEAIALGSDERVLAMPSYPAQGSVENIDGTVVVKLS